MEEKEIDILALLFRLKKYWIWIVLATLLGAVLAFGISEFLMTEQFTSSAEIYIDVDKFKSTGGVTTSDLNTARSMASTYCYILGSKRAQDMLDQKLESDPAYDGTPYRLTASVKDNTEIIRLTVVSTDPVLSARICNSMIEVSSELISEIFEGGRSNSLGEALPRYSPSSPNVRRNMVLGGLAGMMIACAIIFIIYMTDNRVKDSADLINKVGIPVLGEVPNIYETGKAKGAYGYYANGKK